VPGSFRSGGSAIGAIMGATGARVGVTGIAGVAVGVAEVSMAGRSVTGGSGIFGADVGDGTGI